MNKHVKSVLLPLLVVIYPVIFLYSFNAGIVQLRSMVTPILVTLLFGAIVFGIFFAFQKKTLRASLSAVIFFIFFYSYDAIYQFFLRIDRVQVDHFLLLPVVIVFAGYAAYFSTFLKTKTARSIQNILLLVMLLLLGYNIFNAVPAEIKKAQLKNAPKTVVQASSSGNQKHPDIYFFIFDEYAGFDIIKNYWHQDYVDDFEAFLEQNQFFVANKSRSRSGRTALEVSSRLNMKAFPIESEHHTLVSAILNNKAMQIAKSYGYTTVAFNAAFPPPFQADYDIEYDANIMGKVGLGTDQFDQMILDRTMFSVLGSIYRANDPETIRSMNMTLYTLEKVTQLSEVKSPKFVFIHLLFPHTPFIFDKNGKQISSEYKMNWNYYIGQHEYSTKRAQEMVKTMLANADPNNPPVIILQSDHGARNLKLPMPESVVLKDYPEEYQYHILNALHLPGFDYSQLSEDMDPLDALAIVFNHYLNAGVTVERAANGK